MDDGRSEKHELKQNSHDKVKSVVAAYLNKRQFVDVKPRKSPRKVVLKQALLDNRISRCNSILFSFENDKDNTLLNEYGSMFQKFVYWLKDKIDTKQQCMDVEPLVGPLFCHLYLDLQDSGQAQLANSFYMNHIAKVDESKCDETVRNLLKSIHNADLRAKFRSAKVVVDINAESLLLLRKFVTQTCHVIFLHALQTWFELKTTKIKQQESCKTSVPKSDKFHEERQLIEVVNKDVNDELMKLHNAIQSVQKLPLGLCNVGIVNSKFDISCGLIKRQAGLMAYAESNALLVKSIKALDPPFGYEDLGHIKFTNHSRQIYCVSLSSNNDILCTGSADHTISIYSLKKLKILKKLLGHLGPVYTIALSPDSKYLLSGSADTTARLWSLQTGRLLRVFAGHFQAITSVDFHPNTLYVATGSADRNVRLWSLQKGDPVRLFHAARKEVYSVAFGPNGYLLAAASDDKVVRVYELASSKVVHEFRNEESVTCLLWSSNSKELCGGTLSGVVKVWDCSLKDKEKEIKDERDHTRGKKYNDSIFRRNTNGRILSLEFSLGTWACLTVPKLGHSPVDTS
ncbi:TAF5-like RNA polymerase II p300/CBP-associated factor-associated factor 65 kDa subunit 5L [Sitophilus oryzae]|uniref:TAF5-like RNA polymerase II p300/CBP-associated factor-associated factor 65 kDa subunit 5L n=1 Tax=Sitophilus oryzae TaxID=7048 RepID=A0A6J2XDE1_SITOR|nr:TAF5-like RNA polymerase II p300/CBP-associated factor-associated factor 65 kDa subunit 5L [Sitophilus oryzae]